MKKEKVLVYISSYDGNLAGNIGGGNVVGVATAIVAGGYGAIFWMWLAAFFGMALKYGEIVLSQIYRGEDEDGNILSGPMYYIRDGLKAPALGIVIAVLMTIKMMGANLVQSNTIATILADNFKVNNLLTGIILTILLFMIAIGGLKRLAKVATSLVPIMSILYVVLCLLVIIVNIKNVPLVFKAIFDGAFSFKAAAGGVGGLVIARAMQYGIARGMYSNEAGEGTAPFAHGTAIVDHPVEEGITGVTEVFLDTIIICSLTAITIGVSQIPIDGETIQASNMAISAIGTVFKPLSYVAIFALLIFCFTTLMGQWFNAAKSFTYAYGEKFTSKVKFIYPFLCIVGCLGKITMVWTIQDIAMGLVIIPNILALLVLVKEVRKQTKDFFENK
ncbi:MAG: alanine/glycine:cation symporter family protein [Anaerococcus obesiensis]